jgi:hypothetical protein
VRSRGRSPSALSPLDDPRPHTAAAERVEAEGDVATAFTLARIISNIPLARGGPGEALNRCLLARRGWGGPSIRLTSSGPSLG